MKYALASLVFTKTTFALDAMSNENLNKHTDLIEEINAEDGSYNDSVDYGYADLSEDLDELLEIQQDPMFQEIVMELHAIEKEKAENDKLLTQLRNNTFLDVFGMGGSSNSSNMIMGRSLGGRPQQGPGNDGNAGLIKVVQDQNDGLQNAAMILKRFTELKQLVAWMQPKDKRISRYCFYGCWCLPEGAHSFVAGEGRPVDESDRACQNLWFCYNCAKQEFRGVFSGKLRECAPDKTEYAFKLKFHKRDRNNYKKRNIVCRDQFYKNMHFRGQQKSNCARAICECDRGLAMNLFRSWKTWDKSRHRIWSKKVRNCRQLAECNNISNQAKKDACFKRGCLFVVQDRCLKGGDGGTHNYDHEPICCGKYGDDGGRVEHRDQGGLRACCNENQGSGYRNGYPFSGKWFNTITHCCWNGRTVPVASGNCNA